MCEAGAFGPECRKPIWSPWSQWSACSLPCGEGVATRERYCDAPEGVECSHAASIEQRACNVDACTTEWSEWSPCDATCYRPASGNVVPGVQSRARSCVAPGYDCRDEENMQSRSCDKICPIKCPSTNAFQVCSGHGDCLLTPTTGCSQQATCRCVKYTRYVG